MQKDNWEINRSLKEKETKTLAFTSSSGVAEAKVKPEPEKCDFCPLSGNENYANSFTKVTATSLEVVDPPVDAEIHCLPTVHDPVLHSHNFQRSHLFRRHVVQPNLSPFHRGQNVEWWRGFEQLWVGKKFRETSSFENSVVVPSKAAVTSSERFVTVQQTIHPFC